MTDEPLPKRQRQASNPGEPEDRPADDPARRLAVNDLWIVAKESADDGAYTEAAGKLHSAFRIVTEMKPIDPLLVAPLAIDLALTYAYCGNTSSAMAVLENAEAVLKDIGADTEALELFRNGKPKVLEVLREQPASPPVISAPLPGVDTAAKLKTYLTQLPEE